MKTTTAWTLIIGSTLALSAMTTFAADPEAPPPAGKRPVGEHREQFKERLGKRMADENGKFDERMAEWTKQHDACMAKLKERLAQSKLSAADQAEVLSFFETQYKENKDFRTTQHTENTAFFNGLKTQDGLTAEQIKTQIKDHFTKQREENKAHHEAQQKDRQAERAKFPGVVGDGPGPKHGKQHPAKP